jgi:glutathione S-transferase
MIQLWEIKGRDGRRFSLFSWRAKLALKHKGLAFESQPVLLSDKAAIAFSGGKTVPVIRDGDSVVRDSWKIAEYLEHKYPAQPLFGGDAALGLAQTFNTWVDRSLVASIFPVVAPDVLARADPGDETHVRTTFEKLLGRTLEETRAARADHLKRFERALEPMQAALKRQPFVCGAAPAYGDYILFSLFQWARIASPHEVLAGDSPLAAWREKMLDLFDGYARDAKTA